MKILISYHKWTKNEFEYMFYIILINSLIFLFLNLNKPKIMKIILFLLIIGFPNFLIAQQVFTLSVNQTSELEITKTKSDTTISNGDSLLLGTFLKVNGGTGEYTFTWSPDQTLNDPNILSPLAKPSDTITYTLTVKDKLGCSISASFLVNVRMTPTAITITSDQPLLKALLKPNRNNGEFVAEVSGRPSRLITIQMYGNGGQLIEERQVQNFQGLHIENYNVKLNSGAYYLKILSGSHSVTEKFIVQ